VPYDTPWEDYDNRLRTYIGSAISDLLEKNYEVIITSPKNSKIKKYEVFDKATEFLLVKPTEYLQAQKETK
jgi:hypothetical protein